MNFALLTSILALLAPFTNALRPANTSICDYYALTILGSHTPATEKLLIIILINTVVLGTYTTPNNSIPVHGFAFPAIYNGSRINLLGYFTPELLSTDDGGSVRLSLNMSPNGNITSQQYKTLNHIYQYLGSLLGCSLQAITADYLKYQGNPIMFEVLKYVYLTLSRTQHLL